MPRRCRDRPGAWNGICASYRGNAILCADVWSTAARAHLRGSTAVGASPAAPRRTRLADFDASGRHYVFRAIMTEERLAKALVPSASGDPGSHPRPDPANDIIVPSRAGTTRRMPKAASIHLLPRFCSTSPCSQRCMLGLAARGRMMSHSWPSFHGITRDERMQYRMALELITARGLPNQKRHQVRQGRIWKTRASRLPQLRSPPDGLPPRERRAALPKTTRAVAASSSSPKAAVLPRHCDARLACGAGERAELPVRVARVPQSGVAPASAGLERLSCERL